MAGEVPQSPRLALETSTLVALRSLGARGELSSYWSQGSENGGGTMSNTVGWDTTTVDNVVGTLS